MHALAVAQIWSDNDPLRGAIGVQQEQVVVRSLEQPLTLRARGPAIGSTLLILNGSMMVLTDMRCLTPALDGRFSMRARRSQRRITLLSELDAGECEGCNLRP